MKPVIILLTLALAGCSSIDLAYMGASLASGVTTGKGLADHAVSTVTGADCSALNPVQGKYYCEVARTPDTHYNRNPI